MMRRTGLILTAVVLLVSVVGCSKAADTSASSTTASTDTTAAPKNAGAAVNIVGFEYQPSDITVKANQVLTWTNTSTSKHTVTAKEGQPIDFKSPTLQNNDTFVQTFTTPGTYAYFCSIHGEAKMRGTITVT